MTGQAATASLEVASSSRPASQVLAWSRAVSTVALRDAVESLPRPMRHIACYHLGWLDVDGNPVEANGGKTIRPALALLSAQAVGGTPEDAIPVAVAIELVHNFSLLHDDVIDGDDTRRHRPTAWRVFGLGNAILAGNALLTLAFDVLAASRPPDAEGMTRMLCATVQALIEGQHADLAFESRSDVDLAECVRMAEHKTGALISCACHLGALAGGGSPEQGKDLGRFGAVVGLAFQLVDDLQGIWGDPRLTGKPAHSDLRNRKKTMPVVAALTSGTRAADELAVWYQSGAAGDLVRVAELVEGAGAREWSQQQLSGMLADAIGYLESAGATAQASAELTALARLIVASVPPSR